MLRCNSSAAQSAPDTRFYAGIDLHARSLYLVYLVTALAESYPWRPLIHMLTGKVIC
jgi:hypothetical protein